MRKKILTPNWIPSNPSKSQLLFLPGPCTHATVHGDRLTNQPAPGSSNQTENNLPTLQSSWWIMTPFYTGEMWNGRRRDAHISSCAFPNKPQLRPGGLPFLMSRSRKDLTIGRPHDGESGKKVSSCAVSVKLPASVSTPQAQTWDRTKPGQQRFFLQIHQTRWLSIKLHAYECDAWCKCKCSLPSKRNKRKSIHPSIHPF